jgi:hypothetical protein
LFHVNNECLWVKAVAPGHQVVGLEAAGHILGGGGTDVGEHVTEPILLERQAGVLVDDDRQWHRPGVSGASELARAVLFQAPHQVIDHANRRPKDIPPELARIAMNNTPFVNLFYTRSG